MIKRGTVDGDEVSTCDVDIPDDVTLDKNARATEFVKFSSTDELTFRPLDNDDGEDDDNDDDSITVYKQID